MLNRNQVLRVVPMAGPPFPSQIVPISQFWLYLPNHSTVLEAERCLRLLNFFFTCTQRKQDENPVGGSQ
jgi:hypothetical protein